MKEKELTKSDIKAEFDRAMNTPSPNPRYGGLTPIEVIRRSLKTTRKNKKPDTEIENELQLST